MKQLTIVVPEGENNLSSISGAYEIFGKANAYWSDLHGSALFEIRLAGVSAQVDFNGGLFSVRPQLQLSDITATDLIIIPSLNHNYDLALDGNAALVSWLRRQYTNGASIATICTGAFLLAAAGCVAGVVLLGYVNRVLVVSIGGFVASDATQAGIAVAAVVTLTIVAGMTFAWHYLRRLDPAQALRF